MRHLTKLLLTAGLAVTFVSIVLAQRPGGGQFLQQTEVTLLVSNKSVQDELKLTDAQKEKVAKIQEKYQADVKDAGKDKDARMKAGEVRDTAGAEVVKDLKPEQQKRLLQIFVQVNTSTGGGGGGKGAPPGNPMLVFANEHVQKELKLDEKQVKMIKTIADDTKKDSEELIKNAGKDKDQIKEARMKVATLNKEAVDKIVATLTDDQKKLWKDLPGEKFDIKYEGFGPKKKDN